MSQTTGANLGHFPGGFPTKLGLIPHSRLGHRLGNIGRFPNVLR